MQLWDRETEFRLPVHSQTEFGTELVEEGGSSSDLPLFPLFVICLRSDSKKLKMEQTQIL